MGKIATNGAIAKQPKYMRQMSKVSNEIPENDVCSILVKHRLERIVRRFRFFSSIFVDAFRSIGEEEEEEGWMTKGSLNRDSAIRKSSGKQGERRG